jgi:hypothetical protein
MPFTFAEIGLSAKEDQGPEIMQPVPECLKTAGISGIPFFCGTQL